MGKTKPFLFKFKNKYITKFFNQQRIFSDHNLHYWDYKIQRSLNKKRNMTPIFSAENAATIFAKIFYKDIHRQQRATTWRNFGLFRPPRPPDLNPLDFFFVDILRISLYYSNRNCERTSKSHCRGT